MSTLDDEVVRDAERWWRAHRKLTEPHSATFWYMRDNHTFAKFAGTTRAELQAWALAAWEQEGDGMLCPVSLTSLDGTNKRVGPNVHASRYSERDGPYAERVAKWLTEIFTNADIARLLPASQPSSDFSASKEVEVSVLNAAPETP